MLPFLAFRKCCFLRPRENKGAKRKRDDNKGRKKGTKKRPKHKGRKGGRTMIRPAQGFRLSHDVSTHILCTHSQKPVIAKSYSSSNHVSLSVVGADTRSKFFGAGLRVQIQVASTHLDSRNRLGVMSRAMLFTLLLLTGGRVIMENLSDFSRDDSPS